MKAALIGLVLAVSACTVYGCVHRAGDPCYEGDAFCPDGGACLTCQQGKLAAYLCGGAKGCAIDKDRHVTCDQSANAAAGGLCFPEYEGKAQCRNDATGYLTCVQGVWTETACTTGLKCSDTGGVACQ